MTRRKKSRFPEKKKILKLRSKVAQKWMKKLSIPKKKKTPTLRKKVAKKLVRKLNFIKQKQVMKMQSRTRRGRRKSLSRRKGRQKKNG